MNVFLFLLVVALVLTACALLLGPIPTILLFAALCLGFWLYLRNA